LRHRGESIPHALNATLAHACAKLSEKTASAPTAGQRPANQPGADQLRS
jgi:hypothetical protein